MSSLPFKNDIVRRWVSLQIPFDPTSVHNWSGEEEDWDDMERHFFVYGSGPLSYKEFYTFGETLGVHMYNLAEWPAYDGLTLDLVIGTNDWNNGTLDSYLYRSMIEIDTIVHIYSQEMFLFRMMSGIDPFDAPREVLEEFGRGHPALDYLANLGFDWPSCQVYPSAKQLPEIYNWPEKGLLLEVGYQVGKNGIVDDEQRRIILERVFLHPLPFVDSSAYMEEWGEPNTSKRLQKMANILASQVRNAKRRDANMSTAIDHWERDLEWLKKKFYVGKYQWPWPLD